MNDEAHEIWPTLSPFGAQPQLFNLCRNKKEDKNMFNNFKGNSLKAIDVPALQFELIADHEVRSISVDAGYLKALNGTQTFAILCGDAVIICSIVNLCVSDVDDRKVIIEFELQEEQTK